jgi:aspartokinase|tara:strand:+ start:14117 stop:14773 length:657 start_codon:yes stop_codon:yes gene_type:complete
MTSTAKTIAKEIEDDVIVRRALGKGIVSMKSLAVYLIKKHRLDVSSDAVVSAIRRYKEENPLEKKYEKARKVISKSTDIRVTTNIVEVAVEKNEETQKILEKAFGVVSYEKGEILLIIQGEKSIKLIINAKNKEKIISLFSRKSILHIEDSLAEINIHLSDEAVKTPGIISALSSEFMLHDINIYESMSCVPEMLFFVKQKDVMESYQVLSTMVNIGD